VAAALALAAALMAGLVYLNALSNPFVYDDRRVILENPAIRNPSNVLALLLQDRFRPVVNVSYAIDYALSGTSPVGYHISSVLLHMANVVMLFVVMLKLAGDAESRRMAALVSAPPPEPTVLPAVPAALAGRKKKAKKAAAANAAPRAGAPGTAGLDERSHLHGRAAAFAAAAVWAVHPLMTQAVGYTAGRSELLCAFFVLASLLLLHPWLEGRGRRWLALSVASWGLALLSKETAAMLPVVLFAYDRLLLAAAATQFRKRLVRVYVPMLAVVAVAGIARMAVFVAVENVGRASLSWANMLVGIDVVRHYVALMFLSSPQSIFHTAQQVNSLLRPVVIFDIVWLLALGIVTWRVYRRAPVVAFGAVWFVLMLLPSVAMLALDVGEPMAEQRLYVAGAGFAMATGAAFGRLREWPRRHWLPGRVWATVVLAFYLVMLASATVERNEVWSDPVLLWREAVTHAPDIWIPHRGLGDALREKGDYAGAADAYREAARLRPEEANTHLALGVSLMLTNRAQEAYDAFGDAIRLQPGLEAAETGRGLAARLTGRRDEAKQRFEGALKANPNAVLPRLYLAEMYEQDYADPVTALRLCREVQAIAPQTAGITDCIRRNEQKAAAGAPGASSR